MENKRTINHAGYSLVELMVTVLVSSMVFVCASLLLTVGLNQYRKVNAEVGVQTEAQITDYFVTEMFQEADDFHYITGGSDLPAAVSKAVIVRKGTEYYVLGCVGSELRYSKVSGTDNASMLADFASKPKKDTFLSEYVTSFSVSQPEMSGVVDPKTGEGYILVSSVFTFMDHSYTNNSFVMLRNRKVN